MPAEAALSVDVRLTRGAGHFTLDARFEAAPGVTVLFGPSGSGKSTALAAIAGLVAPHEGRIALGEEVWFDAAGRSLPIHERKVAFVFQSLALFPHLTATANVEYGMARTLPPAERQRLAVEMLERLHVGHCARRRPSTFSGGEAQRVALARAFAMTPKVMLLDEPFSALDRKLKRQLAAEFRRTAEAAGIPVLYVTHSRNEARWLADRVLLMEGGRVCARGGVELLEGSDDAMEAGASSATEPPRP